MLKHAALALSCVTPSRLATPSASASTEACTTRISLARVRRAARVAAHAAADGTVLARFVRRISTRALFRKSEKSEKTKNEGAWEISGLWS
jgi:hypothetical protein